MVLFINNKSDTIMLLKIEILKRCKVVNNIIS